MLITLVMIYFVLEYLMQLYSIPRFKDKDSLAFLALVAKATGKLKKGGEFIDEFT